MKRLLLSILLALPCAGCFAAQEALTTNQNGQINNGFIGQSGQTFDFRLSTVLGAGGGGGGGGGVSSVSSGNIANFASITVNNPTTTPAFVFGVTTAAADSIWGNDGSSTAAPNYYTLTAYMDQLLGNSQGTIVYRGAGGWAGLAPGTSGYVLTSGGPSANPAWNSSSSGSTFTNLTVTNQITLPSGGTITQSGGNTLASGSWTFTGSTMTLDPGTITFGTTPVTLQSAGTINLQAFNAGNINLTAGGQVQLNGTVALQSYTTNGFVTTTGGNGTLAIVATPLPVANGGSGTATPSLIQGSNITITGTWPNQTVAASGGGSLPLTTLGDTLYENASPAAARLAGNTAAVTKYLSQTGNGTISAAPAWQQMPIFNVKDYGALGNATVGSTGSGNDDTAAIQATFTAAAVSNAGGIIYLPPGYYRITGAITLPALTEGCYIVEGAGESASIIYPDGGGSAVTFDVFDSSMTGGIGRNGTTFRDFCINAGGTAATAGYCFNIPYLLHEIRNVFVYQMFNFMETTNVIDTHIESCQVYGCLGTLIKLNGSGVLGFFYIVDNSFQCDGAAVAISLAASASNIFVCKNNDFEGFYKGIVMGSGAAVHDSIFEGNIWDEDIVNNTSPYYDFSTGHASKVRIRNEWIVSYSHAISIGGDCYNVTIEGCDIDANTTSADAIRVANGTGIKIQNNYLAAASGAGVHLTSGESYMVSVIGNSFGGTGTGILIDTGALNWFVTHNDVTGASTPITNNGGANSAGTRYVGQNMGGDL